MKAFGGAVVLFSVVVLVCGRTTGLQCPPESECDAAKECSSEAALVGKCSSEWTVDECGCCRNCVREEVGLPCGGSRKLGVCKAPLECIADLGVGRLADDHEEGTCHERNCSALACPTTSSRSCPEDSYALPSLSSPRSCCPISQGCACLPNDCLWPDCPPDTVRRLVKKGNRQPGSCCDAYECIPAGSGDGVCRVGKETYKTNETWQTKCSSCSCRNGVANCNDHPCKGVDVHCSWLHKPDGECCPVCLGCLTSSGLRFNNSERWKEDDCTWCECVSGKAKCETHMCQTKCPNPVKQPGVCCPVCETLLKTRNIKFPDPNAVTAPAPRRNRFTRFERLPRGRQPNLAVDAGVRPRRPERLARPVPALRLPQRPRGLLPGGMPKNLLRTSRHGARCLLPRVSERRHHPISARPCERGCLSGAGRPHPPRGGLLVAGRLYPVRVRGRLRHVRVYPMPSGPLRPPRAQARAVLSRLQRGSPPWGQLIQPAAVHRGPQGRAVVAQRALPELPVPGREGALLPGDMPTHYLSRAALPQEPVLPNLPGVCVQAVPQLPDGRQVVPGRVVVVARQLQALPLHPGTGALLRDGLPRRAVPLGRPCLRKLLHSVHGRVIEALVAALGDPVRSGQTGAVGRRTSCPG
uniref:Putative serine proteinase inhibitor ku family n=1 Tax=Ixodes scapularis TaxID=6945 RepID=A0A4D5RV16_IXOSC